MTRSFARHSVFGALAGGGVTLGSFLSGIAVARLLGVSDTGTVAYILWLVLIVAPIVDIGMSSAIARYVPELRGAGAPEQAEWLACHLARLLGKVVLVVIVAGAAAALTIGLPSLHGVSVDASMRAGPGMHLAVATALVLHVFGSYTFAYFRGVEAFEKLAKYAALSLLLQVSGVVAGTILFGVVGAVAGYALGHLLPALTAGTLLRRPGPVNRELRHRVQRYALFAWGGNIANAFVWSRIELFFLERYVGLEAVGLFAVALAVTSLAAQGPMLLTSPVLSLLAAKHGRNQTEEMQKTYATGTRLLAALALPVCLGMAAIMPALLPLIYGRAFAEAVPAAMVLVCAAAVGVASVIGTSLVQAVERSDFIFFSSIAGAVFAVCAGILLVPAFGLMGAAASRAAIQFLMIVLGLWFVGRYLKFFFPFAAVLRLLLSAIASAAVAGGCVAAIDGSAGIVAAVPIGGAAYLVALRFTRALPPADLALLSGLAAQLPGPVAKVLRHLLNFVREPHATAEARSREIDVVREERKLSAEATSHLHAGLGGTDAPSR